MNVYTYLGNHPVNGRRIQTAFDGHFFCAQAFQIRLTTTSIGYRTQAELVKNLFRLFIVFILYSFGTISELAMF